MSGQLSAEQQQSARFIYDRALQRGLPRERALELASAAYSESGLNPRAKNASSGAAGYFQLLSKGYVDRANAHGGVFDPAANFDAIEPDYEHYWQTHPHAAPGAAARDVERSGEGAGFYSKGLGLLGFLGAGKGPSTASFGGGALAEPVAASGPDPRKAFALAIAAGIGQQRDPSRLLDALQTLRSGLAAQQPDGGGSGGMSVDTGAYSGPGGNVRIAKGADRAGVSLQQPVVDFVSRISGLYGSPLTIGTGTNHNQFVAGTQRESDHWTGWAADIPATGDALTRLGQSALVAAGADPAWARQQHGGLFNIGGKQIIFNSNEGGNHFNHLHVGIRGH